MTDATKRPGPFRVGGVDPDPVTRELLAMYLEPRGVRVRIDATVRGALDALEQARPDVFFCAEAALWEAAPMEQEALRNRLQGVRVVPIVDRGRGHPWPEGWADLQAALARPVALPAVKRLCDGWFGSAEGDGPADPLAGLDALIAETGMGADLVDELLSSFLERMPQYLGTIRDTLRDGDTEQMRRTLHSAKGMCGNLRLEELTALIGSVRVAGIAGNRAEAEAAARRLEQAFDRVVDALHARRMPPA